MYFGEDFDGVLECLVETSAPSGFKVSLFKTEALFFFFFPFLPHQHQPTTRAQSVLITFNIHMERTQNERKTQHDIINLRANIAYNQSKAKKQTKKK